MKYLFAAVLALGTVASFSAAEAAGGCGPGWHRGPYGGCQPNRRAVVVRPAPVVVVRPALRSSWYGPAACVLTAPCGATDAAALIDISNARQKPRSRGAFFILSNNPWRRLTSSNDDDASSGGANDGGDASPNTCDANGGGANPSAGDASPSAVGPSRDDGRGPSALLPA